MSETNVFPLCMSVTCATGQLTWREGGALVISRSVCMYVQPAKCSMIGPVQQEGQGEPCVNRLSHAPPLQDKRFVADEDLCGQNVLLSTSFLAT